MDPNVNLQEQNSLLVAWAKDGYISQIDMTRLTELREALQCWLIAKGFEPEWWKCPTASLFYNKATNVSIKDHFTQLLNLPGSRSGTAALAIISVLREALMECSARQTDENEKVRLKNLASVLPRHGA